ncbi:CynX/NimT family MFS transporter [Azospirillum sp. sgz302134]
MADELLIDAEDDPGPVPTARHPVLLGLALVLVALNLRPALSSVAPVLAELVRDTGISATMASALTTLPVLCLGLFGVLAPGLARRHGSERVILLTLVGLAAGIGLRAVPGYPAQILAAIVAGAGIGIIGTLLPGIVKRDFPNKPALMTGVYTMGLCAGAAFAAGATLPLARLFEGSASGGLWKSWSLALASWAVPALVAAVVWAVLAPPGGGHKAKAGAQPAGRLWRDRLAWQVTLFMGLQSSLAYITMGWLVVILRDRGVEPVAAGLAVSASIMVQVAASLAAPILATRSRQQSVAVLVVLGFTLVGMMGCMFAPLWTLWGWAVALGIGQGGVFAIALTIIVLRAGDPHVATQLSGMAQSVGYAIASLGPMLAGLLHDWSGGWGSAGALFAAITLAAALFGAAAGRDRHVLEMQKAVPPP